MPSNTDTIARLPIANALADGIDDTGDLVPWDARQHGAEEAVASDRITDTYAASINLNTDLAAPWVWYGESLS